MNCRQTLSKTLKYWHLHVFVFFLRSGPHAVLDCDNSLSGPWQHVNVCTFYMLSQFRDQRTIYPILNNNWFCLYTPVSPCVPETEGIYATGETSFFWGCTSGGVYVPCIYSPAMWEFMVGDVGLCCLCDDFWALINSLVCWLLSLSVCLCLCLCLSLSLSLSLKSVNVLSAATQSGYWRSESPVLKLGEVQNMAFRALLAARPSSVFQFVSTRFNQRFVVFWFLRPPQ